MSSEWEVLKQKCAECGIDPELFVREKLLELDERKRILLTPPKRWFADNYAAYDKFASGVLRRELTEAERHATNRLAEVARRRYYPEARETFDDAMKVPLLNESGGRCTVCGSSLTLVTVYIDHIIPLAEGGSNHRLNLQPLCRLCNDGKRDYFAETVQAAARPWWEHRNALISGTVKLTPTKRFCVFMRDASACRRCGGTAREVALEVTLRLSSQDGGQLVYDNLWTLCERCIQISIQ